jgi:WD40 repeat protein
LWNIQTGECLFVLEGHKSLATSVKFSPDGQLAVSGGWDGSIRFWNVETGESDAILRIGFEVYSLAFSPYGRWIAIGGYSGHIEVLDAVSFKPGPTLSEHTDAVTGIDFSQNGQWLVSCSWDKTVRLWDVSTGALATTFTGHCDGVMCVAFSPDSLQIASGGADFKVRLWEVDSSWSDPDLRDDGVSLRQLTYSHDGLTFLSCDHNNTFRQWDAATGTFSPLPHKMPTQEVWSSAFTPDGNQLAFGYRDGTMRLWDCQTSTAGPILEGDSDGIPRLVFSPCCRWIVSVDTKKNVRLWDLGAVESQHLPVNVNEQFEGYFVQVAFSSTGSHFAISNGNRTVYLYDIQSRECQSRIELEEYIWSLTFSPNDQQIAIGTEEGGFYLWDKQSEAPCSKLEGHTGPVLCLVFSPCVQWIASGSKDRTVGVWRCRKLGEVESWSRVHSISVLFDDVFNVAWNPVVPMELVTGTVGGSVQMWRMSIDKDEDITDKMIWYQQFGEFCAAGAIFMKVEGLSPVYQKLLVQRGALQLSEEPTFSHD